jgi:hypothetical protein
VEDFALKNVLTDPFGRTIPVLMWKRDFENNYFQESIEITHGGCEGLLEKYVINGLHLAKEMIPDLTDLF